MSETHFEIRLSAGGFREESQQRLALILGKRFDLVAGLFDAGGKHVIVMGFPPSRLRGLALPQKRLCPILRFRRVEDQEDSGKVRMVR